MKAYYKKIYYSSPLAIQIKLELSLLKESIHLQKKLLASGINVRRLISVRDLRKSYSQSTYKVCHVVGSGLSVLDSYASIKQGHDFVIGFNYAGLLPIPFDAYFVEEASSDSRIGRGTYFQETMVSEAQKSGTTAVFLKCLWEGAWWDANSVETRYGGELNLVKDVIPDFPILACSQSLPIAIRRVFLKKRPEFFINGTSSSVFAVLFAYQMGFRNIVVHGVDFRGPHFFHSDRLDETELLREVRNDIPKVGPDYVHGSGHWMSLEWPNVIAALKTRGTTVYSGNANSLFSTYAPTYIP